MLDVLGTTVFGMFSIALLALLISGLMDVVAFIFKNRERVFLFVSFSIMSWVTGALVISAIRKL